MRNPILILLILFSAFIQAQEKYQLSSHILDISQGKPAPNVKIALSKQDKNQNWVLIDEKYTDNNGRIKDFLKEESNKNNNGVYKLTFYITPYFEKLKQKDGAFDKNLYYDILRRARINPTDFEENLKLTILLDKLRTILNLPASKEDIAMMEASFFMQDKLAIQIINANQSDIKIDEKELKNLWETNKNNYMTKTIYGLETYFIESNKNDVNQTTLSDYYNENKERYKGSDDKIKSFDEVKTKVIKDYNVEKSKTDALKKYTSIKKAELATNEFVSINEDNATFSLDEIKGAKVGEVIKPFTYKDGYLIVRVKSITPPQPMSFEQARAMVLEIYKDKKKKENLTTIAKESLQNFKGTDIGFISRDINGSISGLNESETRAFVSQLFETNNKKDYVILEDKAVIYDILEQRLLVDNIDNNYKQITQQNVTMLKNNELIKDLTNKLKKYYEIKEYIKR